MYETAKETLMYRTVLWSLWERERVGRFGRMALKHVKYHVWNEKKKKKLGEKKKTNHNDRKLTKLFTWITALSNSMKLRAMACRVTWDGWVMVKSSDKTWSAGEGNGKPLWYSWFKNLMKSMKRQKDMTLKNELPRCGICYWRRVEK